LTDKRSSPLLRRLLQPVDIASLVYFRIIFGAIMLWEVYRYVTLGRVSRYFIEPDYAFTYLGFDWVQAWPGMGMHIHFYVMGLLSVFIMVGFLYRLSAALFFLAFTYIFLLEQARYLNHFYFVSLISFLMICVPAHRALSVDGWLRGAAWRRATTPAWTLWILRAEMGFVYFFAGVAKLNGDWLRGYPLNEWLAKPIAQIPVLGAYAHEQWPTLLFSWTGTALDLFIVPALLWKKTRPLAFACAVAFHMMNSVFFKIGIFPWFSIAATLLFFDPDWPRRLLGHGRAQIADLAADYRFGTREKIAAGFFIVWMTSQTLLPLRPFLYEGNTSWTEEAHRFSWHQKLRDKEGYVRFLLTDPSTGESWAVDPRPLLTGRQYLKMTARPYMILQFAHHLSDLASEEGKPRIEVRASSMVSLNGREMQPMIDARVDLAAQPRRFLTRHPWILPLEVPREARWDQKSPPKHPVTLALIEAHRQRFLEAVDVAADKE